MVDNRCNSEGLGTRCAFFFGGGGGGGEKRLQNMVDF